jgi:hypothetical protein
MQQQHDTTRKMKSDQVEPKLSRKFFSAPTEKRIEEKTNRILVRAIFHELVPRANAITWSFWEIETKQSTRAQE